MRATLEINSSADSIQLEHQHKGKPTNYQDGPQPLFETNVYIPGVWDLFHIGHLNVIKKASQLGENLIVGVCADQTVKETKGSLPAICQDARAALITSIRYVNKVIIYSNVDQIDQLTTLRPSIFAIGEDYGKQGLTQHGRAFEFCYNNDISIKRIPRLKGVSTSEIKRKIR